MEVYQTYLAWGVYTESDNAPVQKYWSVHVHKTNNYLSYLHDVYCKT